MDAFLSRANGNSVEQGNVRIGRDYIVPQYGDCSKLHLALHCAQILFSACILAATCLSYSLLIKHDQNVSNINEHTTNIAKLEAAEDRAFVMSVLYELNGKKRNDGSDYAGATFIQHDSTGDGADCGRNDIHRVAENGRKQ